MRLVTVWDPLRAFRTSDRNLRDAAGKTVGGGGEMSHDCRLDMEWISTVQWQRFAEEGTDAHRLCTFPGGWLDRYGDWVVWSRSRRPDANDDTDRMSGEVAARFGFTPQGWFVRDVARRAQDQRPARLISGKDPGSVDVREWNLRYRVEPGGGYSSGLFLDQRLNRCRVLSLRPHRVLNLFAYTCSFSVCAARSGASTLNVDVSKRALVRGKENFALNCIDASGGHRFLSEDVTKIVPRLARRGDTFDLVVLDPPTFGRSPRGFFRIEDSLPGLVHICSHLLSPGGLLLVSSNYSHWSAADLRKVCEAAVNGGEFRVTPGGRPPEIASGAVSWWIRRNSNV